MTFTPNDTIDYVPTTATVTITVKPGATTYDTGTVAFVANTTTVASVSYGQTSTAASVASALAFAVNGVSTTPVKLIAIDNDLYFTAVTSGAAGDSITYAIENTGYNSSAFPGPSFPSSTLSGNLEGGATSGTGAGKPVYSYNDSYDHVGNMVASSNDPVMGNWTFTPDTLNRMVSATNLPVPVATSATTYYCWSYDSFGNRSLQGLSSQAFATAAPACQPQSSASYQGVWAHLAAGNNRLSSTQQAIGGVSYDAAGNVLNDGVNQYLYDGDGRICAVSSGGTGQPVLTGYIYNAEGERVAKGSITAWSCDPTVNGFKPMNDFIVGRSGEQVTEMDMNPSGTMAWQHSNVFALGQVIATYDNDGLHFYLNDPLGTRRAQTDYAGVLEQTCSSLPFGDALSCTNNLQLPTEHHFTGKERDAESGNDYFGARYYSSNMGRWMSPDWDSSPVAIPYADRMNPQLFNLYSYVGNNPLSRTDPDGHCTNGGQQKGFFWCLFNDSDQDAAQARQNLAQYKNISINGKTPAAAAKGLSNTQTVQLDRSVFHYISSQVMSSPGMVLALAIVPGAAEEVISAEAAAAADSGSLLNLNKSLASQEQMGQLAAGQGEAIAGAGTGTTLRDSQRLASQYGGDPGDWQKVASGNYNPGGAKNGGFETHAYQNVKTGQVVEMKTQFQ